MYHLKGLMKEGLVEKHETSYRLSEKGLTYVSRQSLKTQKTREQPQILVALVAKNAAGEYLFYKWDRQPNLGKVSLPHGMLHMGESIQNAAKRELEEKVGLVAPLHYLGNTFVLTPETHRLVVLFQMELTSEVPSAACFWAKPDSLHPEDIVPGFKELTDYLATHKETHITSEIVTTN